MQLPDGLEQREGRLIWTRDGGPMLPVPAGPFTMGVDRHDIFFEDDCKPELSVALSAYFVDEHPVTVGQFRAFVAEGGYVGHALWSSDGWAWRTAREIEGPAGPFDDAAEDLPVSGVSWYEADAYARWAGKQLPSEAQWERAARGTDGRLFPWGDNHPHPNLANYGGLTEGPTPVGRYPEGRSPVGCSCMAGNVNNWCRDWHHPGFYEAIIASGDNTDPCLTEAACSELGIDLPPRESRTRVDRGGGFATAPLRWEVLACPGKTHWPPEHRDPWHGFRCVVAAPA